jgi:hypothetical protein
VAVGGGVWVGPGVAVIGEPAITGICVAVGEGCTTRVGVDEGSEVAVGDGVSVGAGVWVAVA